MSAAELQVRIGLGTLTLMPAPARWNHMRPRPRFSPHIVP